MSYLFKKFPWNVLLGAGLLVTAGAGFGHLTPGAASNTAKIVFLRETSGHWQLWLMDEDGENRRQLTLSRVDKHSPSWCPGERVLHYYTSLGKAMLFDLATGKEHLQKPLLSPLAPFRGPNGERLAFTGDVRERLRDKGFHRLAGPVCDDVDGETTVIQETLELPNGRAIAIQRRRADDFGELFEMKVVELDDPASFSRFRDDQQVARTARVVTARGTVAYISDASGAREIWLRRPGASEGEQLTDFAAATANPTWSSDQRWILFDSDFEGTRQIYRIREDGQGLQRLTDGIAPARNAVVSTPAARRE